MALLAQPSTMGEPIGLFAGSPILSYAADSFEFPSLSLSLTSGAGVPVDSGVIQLPQGSNPVPLNIAEAPSANVPLFRVSLLEGFTSALSMDPAGSRLIFNLTNVPANLALYVFAASRHDRR